MRKSTLDTSTVVGALAGIGLVLLVNNFLRRPTVATNRVSAKRSRAKRSQAKRTRVKYTKSGNIIQMPHPA